MTPITGYFFIRDLGDGEVKAEFFTDKEDCDLAVSAEEQEYGYVLLGTTPIYQDSFK